MCYPNQKVMNPDNYFIYCCAWCALHGEAGLTNYNIAVRGGIVFW